jgi:hypothetical protein
VKASELIERLRYWVDAYGDMPVHMYEHPGADPGEVDVKVGGYYDADDGYALITVTFEDAG